MLQIEKMIANISKIIAEARAIPDTEVSDPPVALRDDDHSVGVLEDKDLQKLFCLIHIKGEVLHLRAMQVPESERTRANPALCALDDDISAVKEIFWQELRAVFPQIADKNKVGIRAGWQVVWNDPDPFEVMLDQLIRGAA